VKVSDLKEGETVKLSFDFPYYSYKWAGSIYKWNGLKWVKLATTITLGDEGSGPRASVSGVGNGTYALIMGNYGLPDVVPTEVKGLVNSNISYY